MFCPGCGTNNEPNARFCFKCGRELTDGERKPQAGGPAWKDFQEPVPAPLLPPVAPVLDIPPRPPMPVAPQVVLGVPRGRGGLQAALLALAGLGAAGGIIAGSVFAARSIDWGSLPLIGGSSKNEAKAGDGARQPGPFASVTIACKDAKNADCRLRWDITGVSARPDGLTISYELLATGQPACSVPTLADKDIAARDQSRGLPGVYVEGRGRYYPLLRSEGFAASGGPLSCDALAKGSWTFAAPAGESIVKLRHPSLAPVLIDLSVNPFQARALPPDDPINFIPAQATKCTTTPPPGESCKGVWEIGPYGIQEDGSPVIFFRVRFEGPANCQVDWTADLAAHRDLVSKGEKGIRIEGQGGLSLELIAAGGLAAASGPQPCNVSLGGSWKFARGNPPATVVLQYPDLQPVQVQIRSQ